MDFLRPNSITEKSTKQRKNIMSLPQQIISKTYRYIDPIQEQWLGFGQFSNLYCP